MPLDVFFGQGSGSFPNADRSGSAVVYDTKAMNAFFAPLGFMPYVSNTGPLAMSYRDPGHVQQITHFDIYNNRAVHIPNYTRPSCNKTICGNCYYGGTGNRCAYPNGQPGYYLGSNGEKCPTCTGYCQNC